MEEKDLLSTQEDTRPVHVVVGSLDDSDLEPHFPSSKSMDNMESIILENPQDEEDDTEDTSASIDPLDVLTEDLPADQTKSTDPGDVSNEDNASIAAPHIASTPMKGKPGSQQDSTPGNPLSQYFMAQEGSSQDDFFDSLTLEKTQDEGSVGDDSGRAEGVAVGGYYSAEIGKTVPIETADTNTDKVPEETKESIQQKETNAEKDTQPITSETVEIENKGERIDFDIEEDDEAGDGESMSDDDGLGLDTQRVRQTSCSEEIAVAFEESKGAGLRMAPSTRSLCKYFTEDGESTGGQDTEGKSFFDSFTAAEGEEEPGDHAPTSLPTVIEERPRHSHSDHSLPPPDTPPVIPGTSPFHSQPATPLTTNNQQPAFPTSKSATPVITAGNQQPSFPTDMAAENSGPLSMEKDALNIQVAFDTEEDAFSQSIKLSEDNRRYDAWIPSEPSRQVFVTKATSPAGSYIPTPEHLTMLGIVIDEPQGDPVKELLKRFRGEQEAASRQTLGIASVPQNEDGLRQLIKAECYRSAVDLTGVLLTQCGQGSNAINTPSKHSQYSMQLWLVRITLLMKLRQYSHAETECQAFGTLDKPDLFFEYYPDLYPGRKGSIVPFKLRLLHAELPLYLGKTQESLDRLHYLHAIVSKILNNLESGLAEDGSMVHLSDNSRNASRDLWQSREVQLLYSIGNCLLNIKDFTTALEIYETLLKKDEKNKAALLCGMGRIYLQMGDIRQAQNCFNKAEQLTKGSTQNHVKSRNIMNKGFLALGQNQFKDAQQCFKEAIDIDPSNGVAVNNMAVTSLYTGKLKEALTTLETLIHSDPEKYLQEGLLFNLCTLYELESSQALVKKQKLLELVSKYKGNGFNVACLKMA